MPPPKEKTGALTGMRCWALLIHKSHPHHAWSMRGYELLAGNGCMRGLPRFLPVVGAGAGRAGGDSLGTGVTVVLPCQRVALRVP
jgi:hypothetical protein